MSIRLVIHLAAIVIGLSGCICGSPPTPRPFSTVEQSPRTPLPLASVEVVDIDIPPPAGEMRDRAPDPNVLSMVDRPTPGVEVTGVDTLTLAVGEGDWVIFNQTARAIADARRAFMIAPREPLRYVRKAWVDTDRCPLGPLRLRALIGQSAAASIFDATIDLSDDRGNRGLRSVVVKHVNDCRELMRRGGRKARLQAVNEAIMMRVLGPSRLAPVLIHLSRATVVESISGLPYRLQTPFLLAHAGECIARYTETRFLVQEQAGIDLFSYFDYYSNGTEWVVVARRAVTLAIRIVEMLRSLHRLGIVHGDIHGGNVLFKSPVDSSRQVDPDDTELVFVDFEFALFYPPKIGGPVQNPDTEYLNPIWLSPWQLQDQRLGRRDDVYRAIEWLVDTLSLGTWYDDITAKVDEARQRGVEDMRRLKNVTTMFTSVAPHASDAVMGQLDHIASSHLATYPHPDDRPEYGEIIVHLQTVLHSLSS